MEVTIPCHASPFRCTRNPFYMAGHVGCSRTNPIDSPIASKPWEPQLRCSARRRPWRGERCRGECLGMAPQGLRSSRGMLSCPIYPCRFVPLLGRRLWGPGLPHKPGVLPGAREAACASLLPFRPACGEAPKRAEPYGIHFWIARSDICSCFDGVYPLATGPSQG